MCGIFPPFLHPFGRLKQAFLPNLVEFSAVARNTATKCHHEFGTLIVKILAELFNC